MALIIHAGIIAHPFMKKGVQVLFVDKIQYNTNQDELTPSGKNVVYHWYVLLTHPVFTWEKEQNNLNANGEHVDDQQQMVMHLTQH